MMKEYRRKPEEVQGARLEESNVDQLARWCGGVRVEEQHALDGTTFVGINVPTMDGVVRASEGDFILKNSRGETFVETAGKFLYEYEEA